MWIGIKDQIFRENSNTAIWVIAPIWSGLVGMIAYLMWRDGPVASRSAEIQYGALAFFCIIAVCLMIYALASPVFITKVRSDGKVTFMWQFPLHSKRATFPAADLPPPYMTENTDSDGDKSFTLEVMLPDG